MISEAQRFWDAIAGKVRQTARDESRNAFRCERYEVTTPANGSKMGVTLPLGTREIFLPYSQEVVGATVGTPVLVVWWGSMSNAKVYYYANGYNGSPALAAYPVGSIYMSLSSADPGTLFGGTWVRIKDTFLLAAGSSYSAGDTGGEATHKLTTSEIPAHTHGSKSLTGAVTSRALDGANTVNKLQGASGIITRSQNTAVESWYTTSGRAAISATNSYNTITVNATHEHASVGGSAAHNNMPPYLAVYMWQRTA